MLCCIIGALASGAALDIPKDAFVIAADAGYAALERSGRRPDLIVGDFDSLGFVPEGPVLRHPVEKDDTDMLLAVREGLRRGCRVLHLYGGVGGRLDHTVANLQTLAFARAHGAHAFLFGGGFVSTLLDSETLRLPHTAPGLLSVFAYGGEAHGVTLEGLHYTLHDASVTPEFPVGVSNACEGAPVCIRVRGGRLLVMWEEGVCAASDARFEPHASEDPFIKP